MDIKEARRICREIANQNQALTMLSDAVDAIESGLAEVNATRLTLSSLENNMKPLIEKRDKITQKTTDLQIHHDNLKIDLEAKHKEYVSNHEVKMKTLMIASEEEEKVIKGRNRGLRVIFSKLESDIKEKQKQLDDINAILNKKRS